MKRPVILVDLDNCIYPWAEMMAKWLYSNGAMKTPPDEAMRQYRKWSVWEDWDIPKGEFTRWWRLGIEANEIYAQGEPVAGSREALWRLSDAEWDIHIATSRLTKFGLHDHIVISTATWLRDNNIPYRNIHFTDNKRNILAQAIVDDRRDNMDSERHQVIFEFPANHNQGRHVTPDEQVEAWNEIVSALGAD